MKRINVRMWIVYFGLFTALLFSIASIAKGGVLHVFLSFPIQLDSVYRILYAGDVPVDTVIDLTGSDIDTGYVLDDDTAWDVSVKYWYPGWGALSAQFPFIAVATAPNLDSILNGITDANKGNFKADVSALPDTTATNAILGGLFNPATTPVTPRDTTSTGDTIAVKKDSSVYQGGAAGVTLVGIDSILSANHDSGSWATGAGIGPNGLIIFAIDSTVTDTLSGIAIFVSNLSGTPEASGITNSQGAATVKLASDTWRVGAATNTSKWSFDDTIVVVSLAFDTVAILGYPVVIPDPIDPTVANVFGTYRTNLNQPIPGIVVTLQLETSLNVAAPIPGFSIHGVDSTVTDSLGFFQFPTTIRSENIPDTTKNRYRVQGFFNKIPVFIVDTLFVPATGNVDITDEIAGRP